MGASASPSGSHPSGHAASGVDGAPRFDPSRGALLARLNKLLHPQTGIKRGIIDRVERGKGSPDRDDKMIPISIGEIREVHAAVMAAFTTIANTGES